MDRLTVLFPFVGILVGLGLADLVFSVHRSIRAGRRWHGLPAAWVAFTFLFVVLYWWIFTEIGGYDTFRSLWRFAFHLVTPLLLVLVCAAALPDADANEPDLLAYYVGNRRYFSASGRCCSSTSPWTTGSTTARGSGRRRGSCSPSPSRRRRSSFPSRNGFTLS
ncbi:hypothetical protein [Rubrivirga litoralis]|uniref:Lycopene cyclase domain-containing protein n=1 Tax=Rubrivirga litoralis TaxID=3075598 RepID=A0ABU3BNN1_9BACT|nr:hypothetical protein [Rubrivirga sp. F394]MDT0630894.1 hypothetical protein [Rubrivirga sp. F394]